MDLVIIILTGIDNKQISETMETDRMIIEEIEITETMVFEKNMYQEIIIMVNIMKVIVFPIEITEINLKIIPKIIEKKHQISIGTIKGTTTDQ